MRSFISILLVLTGIRSCIGQESAQYLLNAVRDLQNLNGRQTLRRADTALVASSSLSSQPIDVVSMDPEPLIQRRIQSSNNKVPPISLTKAELAALYESAVSKGETVKLNSGDGYIHAAIHELDDADNRPHHEVEHHGESGPDDPSGYYYYYYPIKSFLDEMSSQPSSSDIRYSQPTNHHDTIKASHTPETLIPQYQYHAHHHEHNVNITPMKAMLETDKKPKALEPLFMAISGFIGMAVMFILSMLVLPKFGKVTDRLGSHKKNERIGDMATIALRAIEGQDCAERFACEIGKTARAFNLYENRFVKLLRRMVPSSFSKQMDKVGRYTNKKLKCSAIPCKRKNNINNKNNKVNSAQNKKKIAAAKA